MIGFIRIQRFLIKDRKDKSLQYWRSVHDKFFSQCMLEVGKEFTDNMKVVCEEFKVVYK
ncbi:MAG: ASCH domain-containing protein [Clostridium sp.]